MCEFLSWIEINGGVLYLTGRDLKTSRGKKMRERIGGDVCGHGAIREYWNLEPKAGTERECTDFRDPGNFPPEIVEAVKNGELRGIGIAEGLLNENGRKQYEDAVAPLWKQYNDAVAPLWKQYDDAKATLLKQYDDAVAPLWKQYEDAKAHLRKQYKDAVAHLRKQYEDAKATLLKQYDDAVAPLWKQYKDAEAPLWKQYDDAVAPLWKKYKDAEQKSFWNIFADPDNRNEKWR